MLQKRQIKELEDQFNLYSYLASLYNDKKNYLEFSKNISKMWALKTALYTLGYNIKCEKQKEECGTKYYYYEFVKE